MNRDLFGNPTEVKQKLNRNKKKVDPMTVFENECKSNPIAKPSDIAILLRLLKSYFEQKGLHKEQPNLYKNISDASTKTLEFIPREKEDIVDKKVLDIVYDYKINQDHRLINFSNNWNNKLNCNCFTTIRLKSPKYQEQKIYSIKCKTLFIGEAIIISTIPFRLAELTEYVAQVDTGLSAAKTTILLQRMYKYKVKDFSSQEFYLINLKYTKRRAFIKPVDTNDYA